METKLTNRYDFLLLFDVTDGNPNGDPDAGNLPRIDAETGKGLVTDVCIKRKIRNYVQLTKGAIKPFDIFIKEKAILNNLITEAHEQENVKNQPKDKKTSSARQWMCENYYDVRTFGAVMSTGDNAGQVRGPVQFTFARSIDPILVSEHCITRIAVAKEADAEKQNGDNRTMGRKYTVPYALYKSHGFISAHLANQTGFCEKDLTLLWESIKNMFDNDRSAAHGLMCCRRLIVFKHDSELGSAPAQKLFDLVKIERKNSSAPIRCYEDYIITVDKEKLPQGIEVLEMI
ncbi:MAG: type I-C CRISPR-associated protein Cas7/Csd2 [Bacteroidaceae bacterium]